MSIVNFLREKKKIDVNAYQYGLKLRQLDQQRGIDRTRVFANPTFNNPDVSLGYLEESQMAKKKAKKKKR